MLNQVHQAQAGNRFYQLSYVLFGPLYGCMGTQMGPQQLFPLLKR